MSAALLEARDLSKTFPGKGMFRKSRPVQAVRGINMSIARGEAVGVVGESGSGKSTLGRLMLGLMPPTEGSVAVEGRPLSDFTGAEWRRLRRRLQIVFQDPYGSLDPRRRVGSQIADGIRLHGRGDAAKQVAALLGRVGLEPAHAERFPHEFSGGQRQRIGIARALSTAPDFLVADEPVSALDVSIQAQVIQLLAELRHDLGLAMLFISHDLPVVATLCDRVTVMYLGRVMEEGPARPIFNRPVHPYTRALLSATPRLDPARRAGRILLKGDPPSPADPPSGCVFRTRCQHAVEACAQTVPALAPFGDDGRRVACIRAGEIG
ncbi:ABC transporter ATP-binding protein [Teichococcus oryzae]|uniref:ATP-binding cassette domain-containing protein n=1 Tax=Teichococcus oryzae TaxID=1608942 RepID=A0A5B2TDF7_9PROT|nr:oligopeptide/dipeptide ABC transporter ATP-binding protein [Pseudoroseomonas oryzae]KAA2211830.1 ATP-binding cassette domain-containing protein [Pseudoroseomonas oryzae]